MEVLNCKMCGGNLIVVEGKSVAECESCGRIQTLTLSRNEKTIKELNRANEYRKINEYDRALDTLNGLLSENDTDSEIYWDIVLCKFGVEYVVDPLTKERKATINRMQKQSILSDPDFLNAVKYATPEQKEVLVAEARYINSVQDKILAISEHEEPFDIFICYKETDEKGNRTKDSVIAQNIYNALTKENYKVFFSRITLEDKIGEEYEPYIFAALNSAKVMLSIGSCSEYFNAVWVKNEWSRFLTLMKTDSTKKLIPVYIDNAYYMPAEFVNLQGQDAGKLGFEQDLVRGVKKLTNPTGYKTNNGIVIPPEVKEGEQFLEKGQFGDAKSKFGMAVKKEPYCWQAYWGVFKSIIHAKNNEEIYYPEVGKEILNKNDKVDFVDYYGYAKQYAVLQNAKEINFNTIEREYKEAIKADKEYNVQCDTLRKAYQGSNMYIGQAGTAVRDKLIQAMKKIAEVSLPGKTMAFVVLAAIAAVAFLALLIIGFVTPETAYIYVLVVAVVLAITGAILTFSWAGLIPGAIFAAVGGPTIAHASGKIIFAVLILIAVIIAIVVYRSETKAQKAFEKQKAEKEQAEADVPLLYEDYDKCYRDEIRDLNSKQNPKYRIRLVNPDTVSPLSMHFFEDIRKEKRKGPDGLEITEIDEEDVVEYQAYQRG